MFEPIMESIGCDLGCASESVFDSDHVWLDVSNTNSITRREDFNLVDDGDHVVVLSDSDMVELRFGGGERSPADQSDAGAAVLVPVLNVALIA